MSATQTIKLELSTTSVSIIEKHYLAGHDPSFVVSLALGTALVSDWTVPHRTQHEDAFHKASVELPDNIAYALIAKCLADGHTPMQVVDAAIAEWVTRNHA